MTIKTLLVAASGGSASDGAIELACRLAAQFKAHVEAYHVMVDPVAIFAASGAGDGIAVSQSLIDEMAADADATAAKTKAAFDGAARRHGLTDRTEAPAGGAGTQGATCCWREEAGYAPGLVARRARFFDLAVLGRSERAVQAPYTDTIEQTLAISGRPMLVAPSAAPAAIGRSVALAWNGSDESVRALSAALPFLTQAETVTVITAGAETGVADLVTYLAWHGIAAVPRDVPQHSGETIGKELLGAARAAGADLLVMGGYGHRPWRESLFGGATREVLAADAALPLLVVH
jgi:nucleotide-binding universal stress UspA family protein